MPTEYCIGESMPAWLSLHLRIRGEIYGTEADEVITRVIAPAVHECRAHQVANEFFFIRYLEGGPHLRLRLLVSGPDDQRAQARDIVLGVCWRAHGSSTLIDEICEVPYEPERDRYGGSCGVRVAERFFEASSKLAIAMLRSASFTERPRRLSRAVAALVAGLQGLTSTMQEAAALGRAYAHGFSTPSGISAPSDELALKNLSRQNAVFRTAVETMWRGGPAAWPADLCDYYASAAQAASALEAALSCPEHGRATDARRLRTIAAIRAKVGYLHMTSNRLGASNTEERGLAAMLLAHLSTMPDGGLGE